MATWKKVVVSGSAAHLLNVTASNLTNNNLVVAGVGGALQNSGLTYNGTLLNLGTAQVQAAGFTGSFTGSFKGDGSQLTGVVATNPNSITNGEGIAPFSYNGLTAQSVAVSGAVDLTNNAITKWDNTANKFQNSSLTDNGTAITGTTSIQLTGANSSLTGSFTGSFKGDGSGLTGIASSLAFAGGTGTGTVALQSQTFTIAGTANEVETAASGQTITIGLPNDVTIGNNLIVSNDLTVNGTTTFINTQNLYVEDKFILLASGSTGAGEGGIVIQQGTQNVGEVFGWDNDTLRWAITGSFSANNSSYIPDAFMAAVISLAGTDPNTTSPAARYNAKGNIYVATGTEDIWIYS